ncbi:MAG: addiction module protein [Blastocatellia bacterium]
MSSSYEELFEAVLALPAGSRAMLAEHLLESLDDPDQKTRDAIWAQEAERRAAEIETGRVAALPGDEVMKDLRSRLK